MIPLILLVDAMSVFAAVTATFVKIPAEKSLLCHIQFIRELLDQGTLKAMIWADTRDMSADGLTKGAVERTALHQLLDGLMVIQHEMKLWSRKLPPGLAQTEVSHFCSHLSLYSFALSDHLVQGTDRAMSGNKMPKGQNPWKPSLPGDPPPSGLT